MKIYDAKINHLTNPVGYMLDSCCFSWKVKDAAGIKQQSARIQVALDRDFMLLVKDTGCKCDLDNCATLLDINLKPKTRYYWKVEVVDDTGDTCTSDVQFFETGKMDEPWVASWITCEKNESRHPLFYKDFEICDKANDVCKKVTSARLYICGLGLFEAYIDDVRIGNEYFTPYSTDYNNWVQYITFDVTSLVQNKQKLRLAALLGNGWYKGRFGYDAFDNIGFWGDEFKLIAELHIYFDDGTTCVCCTDDTWSVKRTNICFSNLYDGEHVDLTLPKMPLEHAVIANPAAGKLCERLSLPVVEQQKLKPVELIKTPAGELVFDLGQEITGIFELKVDVPEGQKVHVQTGEILQNGNFYNENLRTAKSEYVVISDGKPHTISPHFTFYGYRYAKVQGVDNLKISDFVGIAMYSDMQPALDIHSNNKLVDKFFSNVCWGMRDNFLDVPTDCPQRDERMGWTGDAQVFCKTATYLYDTCAFYNKYLYDMKLEQDVRAGAVPCVVPCTGQEIYASVWGDAACIMPWVLYKTYGDKQILRDHIDQMQAWVDYVVKLDSDDHKWRAQFHYGDWLALDLPGRDSEECQGATDKGFIASIYLAYSAKIVSASYKILGKDELASKYQAISNSQYADVKRDYFDSNGTCKIQTQTALVLKLLHGLSGNSKKTREQLALLIKKNGGKLNTGFVGTPLLLPVLSQNGMTDIAYDLLLNEEFPGWLREVKLGATTVWERWNSLDDEGIITGISMNSMNHYAYGSVLEWVIEYACGLHFDDDVAGCKHAIIAPAYNKKLGRLSVCFDSPSGVWRVEWNFTESGKKQAKVAIPFGCTADVDLGFAKKQSLKCGTYDFCE